MAYVFISYSHKDKEYAHKLADALDDRGIQAWIDDRIDYGSEWPKVIQDQLDGCDAFIVILSNNAYGSKWVQNEVARADRKKKPFFPLLLKGAPWLSVEATQYVDVRSGALPPDSYFDDIKKRLGMHTAFTGSKQGIRKWRPQVEQQLIDQIVNRIYPAITKGPDAEWEIGLFKINYHRPGKNPPPWLKNEQENYYIGSEVIDLELLKRFDPKVYLDYKTNHDRIMQNKNIKKMTSPIQLDYILEIINLRKRLNLSLGVTGADQFSKAEVQEFAGELIDIHKDHHIPVGEIDIK